MSSKHVRITITNHKGTIIDKSTTFIDDGDTLVASVPEDMTVKERSNVTEMIKKALSDPKELIVIPDSVKLSVIKKK